MAAMLTLDGYVRVSRVAGREGDSFISPDVQRDTINTWARLRGVQIAEWHTDLDVSGGTMQRPGLKTVLARVRSGATGGIAVARLDRLSRASVVDALNIVEEVHDAGGQIAAIDLGIDPTTPFGEFAMTIMLALARMERRRIAEQWRISRQRAVQRGVHIASARPTGYQRRDDGRLEPHPDEAPVVAEMFRRRAVGASWTELSRLLDERGVRGPYGPAHWTNGATREVIRNRVHLGEARSGEFVNPAGHEPLVDRATWEAAQIARGAPATRGEPSLLAGLLRCAGCRHVMKPDRVSLADGTRARTYRCRGRHSTGVCQDRAAVMGHLIEGLVEREVMARVAAIKVVGETDDSELAEAQQAASDAEAALVAYRDDERILAALGPDRYIEGLTVRARAADDAHALLAELRVAQGGGMDFTQLAELWPEMDVEQRRMALASMLDCVFIRSGRALALDRRVLVFWRGEGPAGLPRRGRTVPLEPFSWPGDAPGEVGATTAHDLK